MHSNIGEKDELKEAVMDAAKRIFICFRVQS